MHPCTSSVVPEHFQETNKMFRTFLFSCYVFRDENPAIAYRHESNCNNLCIMRKHKKIENALPNKYYVLPIFLTDFCTNPLCPKTVAIFLQ
jgi:hypothetical protein